MATPCGISYADVLEIIKEKVLTGNYNGRAEVMKGLQKDGLSYSEAKAVTDAYYQIYRRISNEKKVSKPNVILSPQEKLQKRLNNIAVDYLNGNLQGFPMSDADVLELEKIYEKMAKADTPTLKEKYNEEASIFVQKFLPNYSRELFRASVYGKPLLAGVFFVKSMLSNIYQQLERSLINSVWDGKRIDFTGLWKFDGLANSHFINVFKGGVPATSLYQSEANSGTTVGRVEEFSIKGTNADSSAIKSAFYNMHKFLAKFSNRLNAAPDTRGILSSAERHFYQLLKEIHRETGLSANEAQQKALEMMELSDEAAAIDMAKAKFNELGLPIFKENGKTTTSEFDVAVKEYRRLGRNEDTWAKALQLAKDDFWKKNMLAASELGFGDYGIFGFKAQLLGKLRSVITKGGKSNASSAFNLYAFGFLNGAANFAEDALERMPLYAAVKLGFLQSRKGKVSDAELQKDISRRQRDIIVKNITTAMFFTIAQLIEEEFCDETESNTANISEGRTQIGVCGIPAIVPPQMMAVYKMYKLLYEGRKKGEDWSGLALKSLPILQQSNEVGLGGAIDKIGQGFSNVAVAASQGNNTKVEEEVDKLRKTAIKMGADYANSFIPFPSRVASEAGVIAQRSMGLTQKQVDLPFAIDDVGNKKGFFESLSKVSIASLGNVTGVSEIMLAANNSNKNYAVDWQGRRIVQFRGSDITGSGIQYESADDIIATAGIAAPYINRLSKIDVDSKKSVDVTFDGKKIKQSSKDVRYLTDEEFFNASVAMGEFNKDYFKDNEKEMIKLVEDDKDVSRKVFKSLFTTIKSAAVDAVGDGIKDKDGIKRYIENKVGKRKDFKITNTEFNQE
jgi:hypothetical protein